MLLSILKGSMPILFPVAFTFIKQVRKGASDSLNVVSFSQRFSSDTPTLRLNGATKMALNPVFRAGRTVFR